MVRLAVAANLAHTWAGDLDVSLRSPSGKSVTLRQATGDPGTNIIIAVSDVQAFMGERARGTWILQATDHYSGDVGRLNSWSLNMQHTGEATSYQEWAATYPGLNLTNPSADLDGDGIPNFVEFLLRGFTPQGADRLPTLEVDPENDQYFQFVVQLRPNVEHAMISVQLAPSLSSTSWTEAVTVGDNIIVDQSVPEVVKVKLKRSLGSMFVRLKGVQF